MKYLLALLLVSAVLQVAGAYDVTVWFLGVMFLAVVCSWINL